MLVYFMYIVTFLLLIPILVGIRRFSRLEVETKWLLYMLVPVAVNQFFSIWWSNYVMPNNLPFYYLYILLEVFYLVKIYSLSLKSKPFRLLIWSGVILFFAFFIFRFAGHWDRIWVYSTEIRALEAVIVIILSSCYFHNEYRKEKIINFLQTPGFWIHGGLILYFSCNLLLFAFSDLVFAQNEDIFQSIWFIHGIVTILLYLAFTIAFLCIGKETKF